MYYSKIFVKFIDTKVNFQIIQPSISKAVRNFNSISRKVGKRLWLDVRIDFVKNGLEICILSEFSYAPGTQLRRIQSFSKILAADPFLTRYVKNGRLLYLA